MRLLVKSVLWLCMAYVATPISVQAQVDAIYDQGSAALIKQLQRLQTTASVLHTGAHPDDEDSALVAYHARGINARTAYISLTRGSGGQNIIGPEQSDALGVIRTEELLQARRLDGAQQFFTRANDFGFSKYRSEASNIWPEELILEDMVRTIRQFRPDVIVSRWNGTSSDGHGHHQFAGYLTPIALAAAADPDRFPEQINAGLTAWQVQKLYVSVRSIPELGSRPTLRINTGEFDSVLGKSYFAIGMQGRSQQKTQQMGSLELQGDQFSLLQLTDTAFAAPEIEQSIFDGIDTSILGISRFESSTSNTLENLLLELAEVTAALLENVDPLNPQNLIPDLLRGYDLAQVARDAARSSESARLLDEKIDEFEQALIMASATRVDALIESETLVPDTATTVAVRVYLADDSPATVRSARLIAPADWAVSVANDAQLANEAGIRRQDAANIQSIYRVDVPADANITQPYWLATERDGAAYDWNSAGAARTQAFAAPLLSAEVVLEIEGRLFTVTKEVEFRQLDRVRGEVRRRIDVVPKVSVEPAASLRVIPLSASSQALEMVLTVRSNSETAITGVAQFALPEGWTVTPANASFTLGPAPSTSTHSFTVTLPDNVEAGKYRLPASAIIDGNVYQQTMREIAYPHISSHRIYSEATMEIEMVDVLVADVNVAYVMGSGDLVPESLQRLGVNVKVLSDAEITTGDLSQFDVIIIGIRASQTRPAFVANNQRLLDFAIQGGTLIVQYQQPDFAAQNLAPFAVGMARNVRVVDETAPITILQPDHPVFTFPNQINARDFEGWVQERNNYNFTSFDRERYTALTEAHDEGEPPSDGAMLYARLGDGHYVYTSYSWFRQLPNGVPGAYRIFANLISLPAAER